MQLVEKHIISRNHPYFAEIDAAAFASKNLFNAANYEIRQHFFATGKVLNYPRLAKLLKTHEVYLALPRKVSQWVLKMLEKAWKSFLVGRQKFETNPSKFLGKPQLPRYKDKEKGRNILVYTIQAISAPLLRLGRIKFSGLNLSIKTKQTHIDQVRIVPRKTHYVIEVVYTADKRLADLDNALVAGLDLGIDNLAAITVVAATTNKPGFNPLLVNGRPLKSINQYYNKYRAKRQSILEPEKITSKRIERMTDKRNRRIDHYLHTASRRIVERLVQERIGVLVVGRNPEWKQEVNLGKATNQKFVQIPHARFVFMLKYKCERVGIRLIEQEEAYTSKTSFLDNEPIQKHERYTGRRLQRGLFRSSNGIYINADVNGSYNIIRKAIPAAFAQGIEAVVVRPVPLSVA